MGKVLWDANPPCAFACVPTSCRYTGKAESMKLSVRDLVFGAPRLLEWLGWSITKRPHLLGTPANPSLQPCAPCSRSSLSQHLAWHTPVSPSGPQPSSIRCAFRAVQLRGIMARQQRRRRECAGELANLLEQSEAKVVEEMLTHALPPLVEAGNRAALEALAQKSGVDPATLVHNHCHTIIAKCLYEGKQTHCDLAAPGHMNHLAASQRLLCSDAFMSVDRSWLPAGPQAQERCLVSSCQPGGRPRTGPTLLKMPVQLKVTHHAYRCR